MAYGFDPSDVSRIYQHETSSMADADARLTSALERKAKADKEQRVRDSGKRSGLQKLLSAAARGAAAYYTGGLSETMGGGQLIDQAMLGTDSEGRAVRNEYGDLVGLGSAVYQGMDAKKAAGLAGADAAFDKQYARRSENVQRLFDNATTAEARNQAQRAQNELQNWEQDYYQKRKDIEEKGFFDSAKLGQSDYRGLTRGINPEERQSRSDQLTQQQIAGREIAEQKRLSEIQREQARDASLRRLSEASKKRKSVAPDIEAGYAPDMEESFQTKGRGYVDELKSKEDEEIERLTGGSQWQKWREQEDLRRGVK